MVEKGIEMFDTYLENDSRSVFRAASKLYQAVRESYEGRYPWRNYQIDDERSDHDGTIWVTFECDDTNVPPYIGTVNFDNLGDFIWCERVIALALAMIRDNGGMYHVDDTRERSVTMSVIFY